MEERVRCEGEGEMWGERVRYGEGEMWGERVRCEGEGEMWGGEMWGRG